MSFTFEEIGEITDAIYRLRLDDPVDDVQPEVWQKLTDLDMVRRWPKGKPALTPHGVKTYTAIEAGDDVPEFDAQFD